jgi:hypothetical protein
MGKRKNTAANFFSVPTPKARYRRQQYVAVWPCGTSWQFDAADARRGVPVIEKTEQTGMEIVGKIREVIAELVSHGAVVKRRHGNRA